MQITPSTTELVKIKSKAAEYAFGSSQITFPNRTISKTGEYDIAGVQIEVELSSNGPVFLVRDEDLLITYVSSIDEQVSKLEHITETSILLLDLRSDTILEQVQKLIKSLEPAYIFLMGAGASPETARSLGYSVSESSSLKVSRTSLPLEGSEIIPTW